MLSHLPSHLCMLGIPVLCYVRKEAQRQEAVDAGSVAELHHRFTVLLMQTQRSYTGRTKLGFRWKNRQRVRETLRGPLVNSFTKTQGYILQRSAPSSFPY